MFVGFGSMSPDDAARVAGVATAAARQAGVRLVLQAGRAGLAADGPDGAVIDSIGDIPHDWLFPQMAAVVHHAGAGTTGAGLRAGVPAVTVPMIGDQPFWAARIAALGAGPPPIRYRRLSVPVLTAAIQDAITRPSYRARARTWRASWPAKTPPPPCWPRWPGWLADPAISAVAWCLERGSFHCAVRFSTYRCTVHRAVKTHRVSGGGPRRSK